MIYTFKFKLEKDDLFNSSMNFNKNSKTFYFDIIFTIAAIIIILYMIFNKSFFYITNFKKFLLILCVLMFPVIQPLIIYIKISIKYKKLNIGETTICFDNEKVYLSTDKENSEVLYKDIYNFIKFKNMCVIMFDSIHGQIIPDRAMFDKKDEFFEFVSKKIKTAKEEASENNGENN